MSRWSDWMSGFISKTGRVMGTGVSMLSHIACQPAQAECEMLWCTCQSQEHMVFNLQETLSRRWQLHEYCMRSNHPCQSKACHVWAQASSALWGCTRSASGASRRWTATTRTSRTPTGAARRARSWTSCSNLCRRALIPALASMRLGCLAA